MEGWVASRVSISTVAVGSHCGAVGLGQHFDALSESNTQHNVLAYVPEGL